MVVGDVGGVSDGGLTMGPYGHGAPHAWYYACASMRLSLSLAQ